MSDFDTRMLRVLTTFPKNIDKGRLVGYSAAGGASAALLTALLAKKNKLKKSIIAGVLGSLFGGGLAVLRHNAESEAGGHYSNKNPEYYDPKKINKYIDPKIKDVVFYVAGAGDKAAQDIVQPKNNMFLFNWADGNNLAKAIDAVPADHDVRVVAHSAGGTAFNYLDRVSRNIKSVDLLDAVDLSPTGLRNIFKIPYKKPTNIGRLFNHLPATAFDPSLPRDAVADKYVDTNPFRILNRVSADKTVIHDYDNHSMNKSGLRLTARLLADMSADSRLKYIELLRNLD